MITLEQTLKEGCNYLSEAAIEEAEINAWLLMEYCFGITRVTYYMNPKQTIAPEDYNRYQQLLRQRASRIPLEHITNTRGFYGLDFYVNEHVLIPRQDTELLVEEAIKYTKNQSVLDVCTGSGCIIISLAKTVPLKRAVGLDISLKALEVARENARRLEASVKFIQSDLFTRVTEKYDLIVSNPPYIPSEVILTLEPEVRLHEPILALDGLEDGLYFYRRIVNEADKFLNQDGRLLFEVGHDQGAAVKQLMEEHGYVDVVIIKDLCEFDRVVSGRRNLVLEDR